MQLPEEISQAIVDALVEIINKRGLKTIREQYVDRMANEMIELSKSDLVEQFMTLAQHGCHGLNDMTVKELAIEIAGDHNDVEGAHEMWDE
jgi:hypothetical protein